MNWAPGRIVKRWESLEGRTWAGEYGGMLAEGVERPEEAEQFLQFASESLSFATTILWALEKLSSTDEWTKKDSLTIHVRTRRLGFLHLSDGYVWQVIGAGRAECLSQGMFEEILHRLPAVKTLNVSTVPIPYHSRC